MLIGDVTIQKRSPLHPRADSPTRRKVPESEGGVSIYLTRHSVLPHIAERVEKALGDDKNSKYMLTEFGGNGRNGVVIRAMGAAIEKAVRLALEIQRRGYSIGILTGTAEVVDDVIPDDNVLGWPF